MISGRLVQIVYIGFYTRQECHTVLHTHLILGLKDNTFFSVFVNKTTTKNPPLFFKLKKKSSLWKIYNFINTYFVDF